MKLIIDLIDRLGKDDISPIDILLAACRDLANKTAADLTSIWFYNESHSAIECACRYEKENDSFSSGQLLYEKDYPTYFKTIDTDKFLIIPDARNHPATAEFTDPYFIENDIYSLLDFTIHDKRHLTGIICCEKTGEIYHWEEDDHSYLRQLSTLISHYIDHRELTIRSPENSI